MNEQNANLKQDLDLDLGQIFRLLLMQSKIIFLIIIAGTLIGIMNYINADRVYKINSMLQIYSNQSPMVNPTGSYDFVLGFSNTADMENINNLYKSRSNLLDVIETKKVNIHSEFGKDFINHLSVKNLPENEKVEFSIQFFKDYYEVSDKEGFLLRGDYFKFIQNEEMAIELMKPLSLETDVIELVYSNPEDTYKIFRYEILVDTSLASKNYFNRNSGLIQVQINSKNSKEGIDILNYANDLFIKNNIQIETENNRKAISFLDERIDEVEIQLNKAKNNLKDFKEKNQTLDVDLEVQTIVNSITEIENKINETNLEISLASSDYTSENPIYLGLVDKRNQLNKQKLIFDERVKNLPVAQQEYVDFYRQVEVTQEIYSNLTNKKLEYSIKEASTLGNIRIVDYAYKDSIVSPQLLSVVLMFIISCFAAIVFAIFRGYYLLPVSNPAELLDRGIKNAIIGVIPKSEQSTTEDNERFGQSVESLIVNIKNKLSANDNSSHRRSKNIVITSPTPANGKSFISSELAKKLASLGNKVLLLDFDLKRGDLNKIFNLENIKYEDYKQICSDNLQNFKIEENLYFIPKIKGIRSSFQFFYSQDFEQKMSLFQEKFDYIVIDTAPLLSVSDTSILMSFSDVSLGIVRHGVSKINEIKQLLSISEQIGISFDGFVYNAYERPSSYYGYYGLYGNYSYQYYAQKYLYNNYEYESK